MNAEQETNDYKVTHKFYIAGVKFHQLSSVINNLFEGDELTLIPEPSNKFDPNAIKIEYSQTMLGYIPKKVSSEVSAMLEVGKVIECVLVTLDKGAKTWEQAEVEIREIFEEAGPDIGDGPDWDEGCRE